MIKNYLVLMLLLSIGFLGVRVAMTKAVRQYFDARMFISLTVIFGAGFLLHNALLLMLLASAALLVISSSGIDAICRLVILAALLPDVDQYITVGGLNLTDVKMSGMLSLAALVTCYARRTPHLYQKFTVQDAMVILMIILFSIFYVRPPSFTEVERVIVSIVLALGLPYYVVRRFARDRAEQTYLVAALAGTAMILSFFAICEAKLHWPLYDAIYNNQSMIGRMSRTLKIRGGLLRAPASFSDSTAFAIFEIVGVFAVISSRQFFRSGWLWWGGIALTVLGTLAAQSRGADLGLLFGLFVLMAVRRRYALAVAVAGGGTALVALLLVLAPSNPTIAAFIGAENHAGADQDYRQTLLRRGLEVGMEHPILGNNITVVLDEMANIKQGDGMVDLVNTYLTVFLCAGFIGLSLFGILIIAILIKTFLFSVKLMDKSFISLHIFAAGGLSSFFLAIGFTPVIYERNAYWLMLLLACCRGLGNNTSDVRDQSPRVFGQAALFPARSLVHRWQASSVLGPV